MKFDVTPSSFVMMLCFVGSSMVSAQSIDETNLESIENVVVTTSRLSNDTARLRDNLIQVDEETIQFVAPSHIQSLLNYVAGAGVQRGNGQEYLPALRSPVLTGASACGGILSAEDGIPLKAAGLCNINELFEAHSEMAERIEVVKGPASVLFGANAIHGVINVITPDTTVDGGLLGIDYGSYGYHRAKLRAGKDYGDTGVGVNASLTRDTGYRDGEGVDQQKVNVRHRYSGSDMLVTTGLSYTNLNQDTAGYITGKDSYKNRQIAQQNFDPLAFRDASSFRLWSRLEWRVSDDKFLSLTPYIRNQDMTFRMHFLPGTPFEENSQSGGGLLSQFRVEMSDNTVFDWGIDAEYAKGSLLQYQEGATLGSAFLVETVPSGKHYDYDVDVNMIAPFFAFQWTQGPWQLDLGGRYERIAYDYTNNMLSGRTREDGTECGFGGCRYSRPESGKNSFNAFSPKISLGYITSKGTHWFARVSRGYRAPQASELYRLQREQQVTELDTVTGNNIEIGVDGRLSNIDYTLAIYRLLKENVIYRDSDFFNINGGETLHKGVELSFGYQISADWRLQFAGTLAEHTYQHSQVIGDTDIQGNDMDTAPNTQFNTRLQYQVTANSHAELEWQHVSSYYTNAENTARYDGHDLVHLRLAHMLGNDWIVNLRINNLLDTDYAQRADYTSFTGDRYFPGRPRNFMASVTYRY